MTWSAENHLLDLEAEIEDLEENVQLLSADTHHVSSHRRTQAMARIRALRNRQLALANAIAQHRSKPHLRLEAIKREVDDLWAAFSRIDSE